MHHDRLPRADHADAHELLRLAGLKPGRSAALTPPEQELIRTVYSAALSRLGLRRGSVVALNDPRDGETARYGRLETDLPSTAFTGKRVGAVDGHGSLDRYWPAELLRHTLGVDPVRLGAEDRHLGVVDGLLRVSYGRGADGSTEAEQGDVDGYVFATSLDAPGLSDERLLGLLTTAATWQGRDSAPGGISVTVTRVGIDISDPLPWWARPAATDLRGALYAGTLIAEVQVTGASDVLDAAGYAEICLDDAGFRFTRILNPGPELAELNEVLHGAMTRRCCRNRSRRLPKVRIARHMRIDDKLRQRRGRWALELPPWRTGPSRRGTP